jgi:hypothetical protein
MSSTTRGHRKEEPQGVGWVLFAACLLGLSGGWNVIEGLLAIENSHVYTRTSTTYVFSDLKTWGWIILIFGVIQFIAAVVVGSGSEFGRWAGIGSAGINAIVQLGFVPSYPFWAILMFSLDVLVIYALAVYGGSQLRTT